MRQTLRPRHIILIDDGSGDRTSEIARAFCRVNAIELTCIRRKTSIGKTPTIKRQAREFDADVEFILDADTILESPDYIEKTVQALYQAVGIASACGVILPLREKDRKSVLGQQSLRKLFFIVSPVLLFFDSLLKSPFRAPKRLWKRLRHRKPRKQIEEKRRIREPYRQRFGEDYTRAYGRPAGWVLFVSSVEKLAFPTAFLVMMILGWWTAVGLTVILESAFFIITLAVIAKGRRLEYAAMGLLATPARYLSVR